MSVKKKFIIVDPIGIHARPAMKIVQAASTFNSKILLYFNGKFANVKSIMNLMALGVLTNSEIEIEATGDDAEEAIKKITEVMVNQNLVNEE